MTPNQPPAVEHGPTGTLNDYRIGPYTSAPRPSSTVALAGILGLVLAAAGAFLYYDPLKMRSHATPAAPARRPS